MAVRRPSGADAEDEKGSRERRKRERERQLWTRDGYWATSLGKIWLLKAIKMGTIYIDDVIFGMNEVKNSPADGGKHRSVDHGHIF